MTALGGERHHFVSTKALTSNGYSYTTAPAIRMTQADHYKTGSRGGGTTATAFTTQEIALLKAKKYQELMQLEVNDFKASSDPDGKYSSLADKYLDQIVATLARCEKYFGFVSQ
ncbi:hypothetical protein [Paenibacillus wenxiniae]|uniref:Uncharacterized protein n=1 Tax=Paenibacillus wenxiniae TaxID=1636843 RepID=A0ABW4RJS8_9BACL